MNLTEHEVTRYARHLILPGFSAPKQERLTASKVGLVGPADVVTVSGMYVAGAGVGVIALWISDGSGTGRGIDVRPSGADVVADAIRAINPGVRVAEGELSESTVPDLQSLDYASISVVGAQTRLRIAAASFEAGVNHSVCWSQGGHGFFLAVDPRQSRCASCQVDAVKAEPAEAGEGALRATLATWMGLLQAADAIKSLCSLGDRLTSAIRRFRGSDLSVSEICPQAPASCPVCSGSSRGRK